MTRRAWIALVLVSFAMNRRASQAGDLDGWIGRRVFTRYGTTLKIGKTVVDDEGRGRAMDVSRKDRRSARIYRVEHVRWPWLWLASETQGVSGWAKIGEVVPIERAIDQAAAAVRANPSPATYISRGLAWHRACRYDLAIADFNEAIRLKPFVEVAYQDRANALEAQGRYAEALADYDAAIRLDPAFDLPYNSRAWLRATCPEPAYRDGKQAVADAVRACQLCGWRVADFVGTLAAAHAEAGDFTAAVRWQGEAIRLHRGADDDRHGFIDRLQLYKQFKPYRSSPETCDHAR
jgi:tetratricopeptide (TPR) repeat protein